MKPTDHKAVLRALYELDGCEASRRAADYIEYLENRLEKDRDYQDLLRRKIYKIRRQRDEIQQRLIELEKADD